MCLSLSQTQLYGETTMVEQRCRELCRSSETRNPSWKSSRQVGSTVQLILGIRTMSAKKATAVPFQRAFCKLILSHVLNGARILWART